MPVEFEDHPLLELCADCIGRRNKKRSHAPPYHVFLLVEGWV